MKTPYEKLIPHAYITKTYHEGKPLPIGTFVLKTQFYTCSLFRQTQTPSDWTI